MRVERKSTVRNEAILFSLPFFLMPPLTPLPQCVAAERLAKEVENLLKNDSGIVVCKDFPDLLVRYVCAHGCGGMRMYVCIYVCERACARACAFVC